MRETRAPRERGRECDTQDVALPAADLLHEVSATLYSPEMWERIASDVIEIEELCFSGKLGPEQRAFVSEWRERSFGDPGNRVSLLLTTDGRLAGFALAECAEEPAHVKVVAVHPEFQGKGLVADLVTTLEDELRALGYQRAKIEAVKANGYAEKVCRAYGRRIVDYFEDSTHAHITYNL